MFNKIMLGLSLIGSGGGVGCGDIINFGTKLIFNAITTSHISSTRISDNKMLIVYSDVGNSSFGTAIVATTVGDVITYGSEFVFVTGTSLSNSVEMISEDKAIIVYRENSIGKAIVATVSGTSISFGTEYQFSVNSTGYMKTTLIGTNKIFIGYTDFGDSQKGKGVIATVAGTVLVFGLDYVFTNVSTTDLDVKKLSTDKVAIVYRNEGVSNEGISKIGTISGTVISYGSETQYLGSTSSNNSIAILSNNKFLISYKDVLGGTGNRGFSVVADVSGTSITIGTSVQFNTGDNVASISSTKAGDLKALIIYGRFSGASSSSRSVLATIIGNTVSYGSEVEFNTLRSGSYLEINNLELGSCKFFISYDDGSDGFKGNGIVSTLTS